jgi:poly-beta-1,6-N-acetyl-D-glucosamine synthase
VELFAIHTVLSNSIFLYALIFIFTVIVLVILSSLEMSYYFKKNRYITYKELLVSPFAPSVSIVVPAYNCERVIIEKVRALFALQYNNFDIIVVNDGSTDSTFSQLKDFYDLEPVDFVAHEQLKTRDVYSYSKSKNPTFSRLMVVDKAHGGKSDALNAGINSSEKELIFCVETDCFLDQNALLKIVKPVLEGKHRVIASRTAVQVANSCKRQDGYLVQFRFPFKLLPALQVIEYLKIFLLERLAWSRFNGFHAFSSGVSLFDKEILIQSGGYNSKVLNPDFELMIRMCRFMHDSDLNYSLAYVAEPICWVDVPETVSQLGNERRGLSSGNFQTFKIHKSLFFNLKYGSLGMFNLPYLFFYECVTPFAAFILLVAVAIMLVLNVITLELAGIFLCMLYFFAIILSCIAVLFSEKSYRSYHSGKDVLKMLLLTFLEPLIYQPLTICWKIAGAFRRPFSK